MVAGVEARITMSSSHTHIRLRTSYLHRTSAVISTSSSYNGRPVLLTYDGEFVDTEELRLPRPVPTCETVSFLWKRS